MPEQTSIFLQRNEILQIIILYRYVEIGGKSQ